MQVNYGLGRESVDFGAMTGRTFTFEGISGIFRSTANIRNGSVVEGRTFGYDLDGRITSEAVSGSAAVAHTNAYAYDDLGRLFNASKEGHAFLYRHDLSGNRVASSVDGAVTYNTVNSATNRLLTASGLTVTHDLNGNVTGVGSDTFGWNALGQMTSATQGGVTTTFGYDGLGRLTTRSNAPGKTWLGWGEIGSGSPVEGAGMDDYIRDGNGNQMLQDAVGSVTGKVSASGVVSGRAEFGPFGEPISTASDASNYRFTGREQVGAGLQYNRNRMYSPFLGRFMSEDPAGFAGSPDGNFFAYCGNDPVNYTDPLGLFRMGWSNGGLWWGDDADHPSMWFGNMPRSGGSGGVRASYRCSGGDDDPDAWMDGPNLRMSSAHEGMDGKSARSRWAHYAAGELGNQVTGAAVAMATGGLGLAAEALGAVGGEVAGASRMMHLVDHNVPGETDVARKLVESGYDAMSVKFGVAKGMGIHWKEAASLEDKAIFEYMNANHGDNWLIITKDVDDWSALGSNMIRLPGQQAGIKTGADVIEFLKGIGFRL